MIRLYCEDHDQAGGPDSTASSFFKMLPSPPRTPIGKGGFGRTVDALTPPDSRSSTFPESPVAPPQTVGVAPSTPVSPSSIAYRESHQQTPVSTISEPNSPELPSPIRARTVIRSPGPSSSQAKLPRQSPAELPRDREPESKAPDLVSDAILRELAGLLKNIYNLASKVTSRAADARVERRIQLIRSLRDNAYGRRELLIKRYLPPKDYELLCRRIEESDDDSLRAYFQDQLRYDYTPRARKNQLVIRMPSTFHDTVASEINTAIIDWFKDIRDGKVKYRGRKRCSDETVAIVNEIRPKLSTTIKLSRTGGSKRDPDLSFRLHHRNCRAPGLVVEVAWSQRDLALTSLAERYIEETNGNIRTVIGVNLHDIYKSRLNSNGRTRPATFSVWQAELGGTGGRAYVREAVKDEPFRDETGNAIRGVALRLRLKDFISEKMVGEIGDLDDPELVITSAMLCRFYSRAVEEHEWDKEDEAREDQEQKEGTDKKGTRVEKARTQGRRNPFARATRSGRAALEAQTEVHQNIRDEVGSRWTNILRSRLHRET